MSMVQFANVSQPSSAATSISSFFDGAAATPTTNHDGAAATATTNLDDAVATPSIHLKNGDFESRGVASSICLHLCICGHDGAAATINLCGAALTIRFQSPRVVSIWLCLHICDI